MGFLKEYQIQILFGCGIVNIMLAFFVMVIKFHSTSKKLALVKIQMCCAALMISDAFSYLYDGDMSAHGYWNLRLSTFVLFVSMLGCIYFLCEYITSLFMASGKFDKLPKRLLLGFILPSAGMTMVIISQFTGIYYSFNENNVYQRGSFYFLSFLIPTVTVVLLSSFVFQYRSMINKRLLISIALFSILPMIAGVLQLLFSDFPSINFASWLASVTLFWFALIDQNEELSKAANTELASGLPNTYGYMYEVDKIIHFEDITAYNGFYFDIVRMNNINNKFGRKNGDEIIVRYAKSIRKLIDDDEIVGRLGGNFFVALIKKSNTDKFLKMLEGLPVEFIFNGEKTVVNVSSVAGGYGINKKNIAAGQIIGACSTAIAYAKNVAHKPYVFLDEALEKELNHVGIIEDQARKGLDSKEFVAYYQPKVDSNGNVLCGAEALARWIHDGELISPMEFVPIMEKNGSICDLDFYILETVCMDIKGWLENGIEPVKVSVNFSRKNLGNPILAEAISKVVERCGIPKDLIQIEVTETIDEFPLSYLVGVVEALQRYGLTVAIDDFGTGSSSINLLKTVSFDVLKIDKSFVDYKNDNEKLLLQNIIKMAQDIGISVIAEGVEEETQIEELKQMNCYEIQGYAFDKPLEKLEFEKRLMNRNY